MKKEREEKEAAAKVKREQDVQKMREHKKKLEQINQLIEQKPPPKVQKPTLQDLNKAGAHVPAELNVNKRSASPKSRPELQPRARPPQQPGVLPP